MSSFSGTGGSTSGQRIHSAISLQQPCENIRIGDDQRPSTSSFGQAQLPASLLSNTPKLAPVS